MMSNRGCCSRWWSTVGGIRLQTYIQGGVLRCPYWISLMGDKERISIHHRSMRIIYPFKKWSLTLLLTSWLQYQMLEKRSPSSYFANGMKKRKKRNPILLIRIDIFLYVKPNMCNYFPCFYSSHIRLHPI